MANTASRLSANGSLTISGYFNEILKPFVTSGLIAYWDTEKGYIGSKNTWVDLTDNNTVITFANPNFTSNTGNITFTRPNNNYGRANLPQLAGATAITVEGVMSILDFGAAMPFGFGGYDVYTNGGYLGFNTANSDVYGISPASVISLGLPGKYIHYAFVMGGPGTNIPATNQIWINGVQQSLSQQLGTTTTSPGFNNDVNNYAFALNGWTRNDNAYFQNITYTSLRIYNRALTPNEIRQNYNIVAPKWGLTPISGVVNSDVTSLRSNTLLSGEFDEVAYNPNNIGPTKNLFPNSQDFTQNYNWLVGPNITKIADVAPDGTRTAMLYTSTGVYPLVKYQPLGGVAALGFGTPGKYYTQSLFVKYVNQQYCIFVTENWPNPYGGAVRFDLLNGTVGGTGGSITNATITRYDNGWYRISATWLIPSVTNNAGGPFYWQPQWRLGNYDGTDYTGQKMLLWGYQLEEGNTATTYLATDFPKNLLLYSEDLANTNNWGRDNCTLSRNTTVDPNGNFTGQMLTSTITGGNNNSFVNQQLYFLPINTNYTYSVYVKQGTSPTTNINFYNVAPFSETNAIITWPTIKGNRPTVTYTTGSGGVLLASSFTESTNGWWRVSLSLNNGSSSSLMCRVYTTTNSTTNVTGYNVYVWGAQLEFGLTATPYISNPNGGQFGNILPLANTNVVMKTTNTGNNYIKSIYDEVYTGPLNMVTNGLTLYMDAAKLDSYPGTGTRWNDIGAGANFNATFTATPNHVGGQYIAFDATYYANTGKTPAQLGMYNQPFTAMALFRVPDIELSVPGGTNDHMVLGTATTSPQQGLHLGTRNNTFHMGFYGADFSGGVVVSNQWYFVTWVWNNTAPYYSIYVNGTLITSGGSNTPFLGTTNLLIGSSAVGTHKSDVNMVAVYNRALSQAEVTQNYNAFRRPFGI